jgi:diadenosine tetraphosphatase ApaH/serine/threonine PP2A family protein phosphatase
MRIGLLADLHANRDAVDTCMEALTALGCRQWVFLGDLVGYGADPGWVVDRVRACIDQGALAVLGNHDEATWTEPDDAVSADNRVSAAWTRTQLDAAQIAFLRGLPLAVEQDDLLYVHANAWAPAQWSYVSSPLAATRSLAATAQWLSLCGHVHAPALYHAQGGSARYFEPRSGVPIALSSQRRWLAIPGSCGQPRDGNPAAACAWFDSDTRQIGFLRLPYDHARSAARIREAGLPAAFADRLERGT